ncbi:MAG: glycosyltransferase family 4 protein [Planctomycetota bacterium]
MNADELQEAKALLAHGGDDDAWGWSGPATAAFLSAWSAVSRDPRIVVVFGNPVSVIARAMLTDRVRDRSMLDSPVSAIERWAVVANELVRFVSTHTESTVVFEEDCLGLMPAAVDGVLERLGLGRFGLAGVGDRRHDASGLVGAVPASGPGRALIDANAPGDNADELPPRDATAVLSSLFPEAGRALAALRGAADLSLQTELSGAVGVGAESVQQLASMLGDGAPSGSRESLLMTSLAVHGRAFGRAIERRAERTAAVSDDSTADAPRAGNDGGLRERIELVEALAAARADSLRAQLTAALARVSELEAVAEEASGRLRGVESLLGDTERERDRAVESVRRYRRLWPPYIAKALFRRSKRFLERSRKRRQLPRELPRLGEDVRIVVLNTGMPRSEVEAKRIASMLRSQGISPVKTVWPGALPADVPTDLWPGETVVQNWWAPDLPSMLGDADIAVVLHPESYGPGPLWHPQFLEMVVAAFASDDELSALVFRGQEGEARVVAQNHLFETDAATVSSWGSPVLAAAFASPAAIGSFAEAVRGESRDLTSPIGHLMKSGRKVLVGPRSFPLGAAEAYTEHAAVGADLPPRVEVTDRSTGPVRALYVTQWIECGGADKGILDLVNRVNPELVRFSLLTTAAASQTWAPRAAGRVDEMVHLADFLPLPPQERFPAFVAEYCRRRRIEVVHFMHTVQGYDAIPLIRKISPQTKLLDQCHILEKPEFIGGGHPVYSTVNYGPLFDHRTVTSRWLRDHVVGELGAPADDVSVIYTGVDTAEEFNPARYEPGAFRGAQRLGDGPLIVFLGRLHEQKRPELFAKVAAEVTLRRPDLRARFVMCGDGGLRGAVELVRGTMTDPDRLVLAGEVGHSGPILRDADLMLMLSEREGLAYVSYESMAMGVPQIFTDVNAQSELITPETGVLLPADADDLVERATHEIIRLLDNREELRAMGSAARRRVEQGFTIERMVRSYEDLYLKLVGRTPNGRSAR